MRIVLATGNSGKLKELQALLSPLNHELSAQCEFFEEEVEETGLSFIENAMLKARYASKNAGLPALADDSGLCVNALNGEPGIYSARYSGPNSTASLNNAHLLKTLENASCRRAYFYCAIVFIKHFKDPSPLIALGQWKGNILKAPQGKGGFGYDPLFQPDGYTHSAAELDANLKNQISHRGLAMQSLIGQLKKDVT